MNIVSTGHCMACTLAYCMYAGVLSSFGCLALSMIYCMTIWLQITIVKNNIRLKMYFVKLYQVLNFCFFFINYSYYDNPCEFLSFFETSGTCPTQLEAHGLPCTCPFYPTNINLPPSVFHVLRVNPAWQWIATVSHKVFGCIYTINYTCTQMLKIIRVVVCSKTV